MRVCVERKRVRGEEWMTDCKHETYLKILFSDVAPFLLSFHLFPSLPFRLSLLQGEEQHQQSLYLSIPSSFPLSCCVMLLLLRCMCESVAN